MTRCRRGTFAQIQPEAEIIQQRELETDEKFAGCRSFLKMIENDIQCLK